MFIIFWSKEGVLTLRAKPPHETEFLDCFQKIKLALNLLVRSKGYCVVIFSCLNWIGNGLFACLMLLLGINQVLCLYSQRAQNLSR